MEELTLPIKTKDIILSLGAESAGNFSLFLNEKIYFSEDFGDLIDEVNFIRFEKELDKLLKGKRIKPTIILSDLHPLMLTTELADKLSKKYKTQHISVQHHLAHIFSAIGDEIITNPKKLKSYSLKSCLGIACDGTGYGFDEKIWGGEIFKISNFQFPISKQIPKNKLQITRIGRLENQTLIGGEMAIREPARMIISIVNKFPISNFLLQAYPRDQFPIKSQFSIPKNKEVLAYNLVKKYYSKNEFEVLWNQLEQNFNCLETSSTARVLDAISVLLGFSKNERLSKHGPVALLEQNSTKPYTNLKPKIERYKIQDTNIKQITKNKLPITNEILVLNTTFLFEYLIKNLHKDKSRLAATAQKYIADGLLEILKKVQNDNELKAKSCKLEAMFFAGGMANNKIMSEILESKKIYTNKKIPRGDAGISFGQIIYYLLADPRD